MSGLGCPFIAGPACRDCDGSCWYPDLQGPPQPEPCEGCSIIVGGMTYCLDYCHGIRNEDDLNERIAAYRRGDLA